MSKIINTSYVVDPLIRQPFPTSSLDFVQDNSKLIELAMMQSFAANTTGDTIALQGCVKTLVSGSTYTFSPGYIGSKSNSEIFYFSGGTVPIGTAAIMNVSTLYAAPANPVTFTDGVQRNVCENRIITITDGTSGTGSFGDYDNLIFLHETWTKVTSFLDSKFNGNDIYYKKDIFTNRVYLKGVLIQTTDLVGGNVFTLPITYRPKNSGGIAAYSINTVNHNKAICGVGYYSATAGGGNAGIVGVAYDHTGSAGNDIYTYLDGCSFPMD
jgi:hypothetical protein